ncbi:MAG: dihydrofolate reductase [Bacteroidia bacterium]|nr:dihydrofolate reductase [Bacteroidia bacterium]
MIISFVAAVSRNNALGKDNKLLWHLPDDFKWFKEQTVRKPVIMGRKTMESLGKPLPKRRNIVISRTKDKVSEGFEWAESKEVALQMVKDSPEVAVIGGGQIYKLFLDDVNLLVITFVDVFIEEADTFFPEINYNNWKETYHIHHQVDERHKYAFDIKIFKKGI